MTASSGAHGSVIPAPSTILEWDEMMKTTILTLGLLAGATAAILAAPVRAHAEASDGSALVREILPPATNTHASKTPANSLVGKPLAGEAMASYEPSRGGRRALSAPAEVRGRYRDLIARHAQANGIPFELADAVVRIESRYNPSAHNGGAVGLMQIKPQTARGLGYGGGASGLTNPDTNLRYGMLYLAQAYRMSGGNTCATVMRYQSGHYATRMNGANRSYCSKARTIMASN
jgi:soluble lytic murein transglycosylase-like protein